MNKPTKHYLIPHGKREMLNEAGCHFTTLLSTLYKLFGDTTEVSGEFVALECGGTTMVEFYRDGSKVYDRDGKRTAINYNDHIGYHTLKHHRSLCPEEIRQVIYGENSFGFQQLNVPWGNVADNGTTAVRVMWGKVVDSIGRETGWSVLPDENTFAYKGKRVDFNDAMIEMIEQGLTF